MDFSQIALLQQTRARQTEEIGKSINQPIKMLWQLMELLVLQIQLDLPFLLEAVITNIVSLKKRLLWCH